MIEFIPYYHGYLFRDHFDLAFLDDVSIFAFFAFSNELMPRVEPLATKQLADSLFDSSGSNLEARQ